jgi:hypothetical protein
LAAKFPDLNWAKLTQYEDEDKVLEELETDCAAKVTAKREEDAMRDDAEDE